MVTYYVFLFASLGVFGLVCLISAIAQIKNFGINGVVDAIFMSVLGLFGLSMIVLMPLCIWCGLTIDVNVKIKNADGKVIERTVKAFEYTDNGNCVQFYDDPNTYCGREVEYIYIYRD